MGSQVRILAIGIGAMLVSVAQSEIPEIMHPNLGHPEPTPYPTWVEANAAISADGAFNEQFLHPDWIFLLEDSLSAPEDPDKGCIEMGAVFESWVNPPDRTSLEKAILHSELVLQAQVTNTAYGFDRGVPGQLLEVAPERTFKGNTTLTSYYAFLPVANFEAGPYRICKHDERYADTEVAVGDQVLLMVPKVAHLDDPYLDLTYPTSLAVLRKNGAVEISSEYQEGEEERLRTPANLLARVSAATH